MKLDGPDASLAVGVLLVAIGAGMAYLPLGFVVGGLLMIAGAVASERMKSTRKDTERNNAR